MSSVLKWIDVCWWRHLFESRDLRNFWCRVRGHPSGPVFYRPHGDEPDYHCNDCGEEI